jgi:hypothetical protein
VSVLPSTPLAMTGLGRSRWQVELMRCRGAPVEADRCRWVLEVSRCTLL